MNLPRDTYIYTAENLLTVYSPTEEIALKDCKLLTTSVNQTQTHVNGEGHHNHNLSEGKHLQPQMTRISAIISFEHVPADIDGINSMVTRLWTQFELNQHKSSVKDPYYICISKYFWGSHYKSSAQTCKWNPCVAVEQKWAQIGSLRNSRPQYKFTRCKAIKVNVIWTLFK